MPKDGLYLVLYFFFLVKSFVIPWSGIVKHWLFDIRLRQAISTDNTCNVATTTKINYPLSKHTTYYADLRPEKQPGIR